MAIDTENGRHENALDAHAITLVNDDGTRTPLDKALASLGSGTGYTLTAAAADKLGGVKQGVAVPDPAADTPTKEEFVALLTSLRNSGAIAK